MKLLKRNQLVILVITLMFITIGYLSYNPNVENREVSSSLNNGTFGDATLVNSNELTENNEVSVAANNELNNNVNDGISEEAGSESVEAINEPADSSISTNRFEDYFISSKLQRDAMYSQMIESYQRILDNQNIAQEQKTLASEEINKINAVKNGIMISENLIKNKDIQDVVIFVNDNHVNVIIKAENPSGDVIAQVQNIVSRELNVQVENIHISSK